MEQLDKLDIHYDKLTFEAGEKNKDEIISALNDTDLFVIFLSKSSLQSSWVQFELKEAHRLLKEQKIKKIFPIIIHKIINHTNENIPKWLQEYNLRLIQKPKVAVRRIKEHLIELSWVKYPDDKSESTLCVGRNKQIAEFEQRVYSYQLSKPSIIFVSGLIEIGRKTFLNEALNKTSIKKYSREPYVIILKDKSSIEDFILSLNSLGVVDLKENPLNLINKSIQEKVHYLIDILDLLIENKEIIYIIDDGCLINHTFQMPLWFLQVIDNIDYKYPLLCCVSKYRYTDWEQKEKLLSKCFFINIPPLDVYERGNLLQNLIEKKKIDLTIEQKEIIVNNLHGFPIQVKYAISIIKEQGIDFLLNNLNYLAAYNTQKVLYIVDKYKDNKDALDFIKFLSLFEFISIEYIQSIVMSSKDLLIQDMINENICYLIGNNSELILLNDSIKEHIARSGIELNDFYKEKIKEKIKEFMLDEYKFDRDVSEYLFSLKEALRENFITIDPKLLIPSHYLQCMKEIYDSKGRSQRIIELADQVLKQERNLDDYIAHDIRYYLCLALIREKDIRFMTEVQNIKGSEHDFLLGFYYRKQGRLSDALERFKKIASDRFAGNRARREIVQIYLQMEDYDTAYIYAKKNYEDFNLRPYHLQAYISCLIYKQDREIFKSTILELINQLKRLNTQQSREMAASSEAMYFARVENNENKSLNLINDAIKKFKDNYYPIIIKCDIATKFKNINELDDALTLLRKKVADESHQLVMKYRSYLLSLQNKKEEAIELTTKMAKQYPPQYKDSALKRIKDFSSEN